MGPYVIGIRVADKRPNDIIQCHDNTISASSSSLKGILEVVRRLNLRVASQSHPASDNNEDDNDELDNTKQVLKTETPVQREAVNQERSSDASKANTSLVPSVDFYLGGVEDILAEDDAVTCGPSE